MIEPPETPHHALPGHRTPMPWFDVAMAVAVLAVSFGSLFVAWHTSHTMEKLVEQNQRMVRAQSTPLLQYSHGNYDGEKLALTFTIRNVGAGPARLSWVRITQDGRVHENWPRYLLGFAAAVGLDRLPLLSSRVSPGFLSVGEERVASRWDRPEGGAELRAWEAANRARFGARVEACYCSVFDECWVSQMDGDIPRPVRSCEAPRPVGAAAAH